MKLLSDISSSIDSYTKSRQIFVAASGKLQNLLSDSTVGGQIVNMPSETSMFHIINSSPVPEPWVASTSGATFLSSLAQIRNGVDNAMSLIESIKDNIKSIKDNPSVDELKNEFKSAEIAAANSEKKELPRLVKREAITNDYASYYRSIVDIQFSSKNLHALASEIGQESKDHGELDDVVISKILSKFKAIWEGIKDKVRNIIVRLRGIAESFGNSINGLLDQIESIMKKGAHEIIKTFLTLSDYFSEFMVTLTEQMFKFLSIFGSIPSSQDYAIENIQIKIPSLRFEYVNMFQVSIPLPIIDPPEMTLNLVSKKQASKK